MPLFAHVRIRRMLSFFVAVLVITGLVQGLELIQSARSSVARADDPAGTGGVFHSLQARLVDTRNGTGVPGNTVGPVTAGQSNSYAVEGQVGIPATGVSAVALSVLVINPSADGYLSVTADPAPAGSGTATALNWAAGETISNSALVAVGSNGHILLKAAVATNVVIDVEGYFTEGDGSPAAGGYVPVTPSGS